MKEAIPAVFAYAILRKSEQYCDVVIRFTIRHAWKDFLHGEVEATQLLAP